MATSSKKIGPDNDRSMKATARAAQVLVLDDRAKPCQKIRTALEERGFAVTYAASMQSIDRLMQRVQVDVVIIDLEFASYQACLELAQQLRERWLGIEVIALLPEDTPHAELLGIGESIFGSLRRPADLTGLSSLVEAAARQRQEDLQVGMRLTELEVENSRLRRSSQLIQDAVAFTGHEWRNQLSLLELTAAVLMRQAGADDNDYRIATAKRIRHAVTAMQRIADNYLVLSKLNTNSFEIQPAYLDPIRDVINPVVGSYSDVLAQREQTCNIKVVKPDMLIWADQSLLISVYDNLISNASKYGQDGSTIEVAIIERGLQDELSVWNSGPGIKHDELELIFERHTRGSQAAVVNGKGVGIGLYLARKIVEAHGGRIWADSKPGAWAKFTITLPKRGAAKRAVRRQ